MIFFKDFNDRKNKWNCKPLIFIAKKIVGFQKIDPMAIEDFFGLSECGVQKNSESAYILFYEARDAVNADAKGAGQVANSSI